MEKAVQRVFDALEALDRHPEATGVERRAVMVCHMAMEPVHARVNSKILGSRMVDVTDKIAIALARLSSGSAFGGRA